MWQVQFPRAWYDIDESVQEGITAAYRRGQRTVVFSVLKSKRLNVYSHYCIDFETMEQKHIESDSVRKVKWTGAPLRMDDATGGGSGLPAIASSSHASRDDATGGGSGLPAIASSSLAEGNAVMSPGVVLLALPPPDTTEPALPSSDGNSTSRHNKIRKTGATDDHS